LETFGDFRRLSESFLDFWIDDLSFGDLSFSYFLRLFESSGDFRRLQETLGDLVGRLFETLRDFLRLFETLRDFLRL